MRTGACVVMACMASLRATPAPVLSPQQSAPCVSFDKTAAKAALSGVSYKACAVPGRSTREGVVVFTFAPNGALISSVVQGPFDVGETWRIKNAFKVASVPEFCPPSQSVAWRIKI